MALSARVVRNADDGSLAGFVVAPEGRCDEHFVAIANRAVPLGGNSFALDGRRFLCNERKIIPGVPVDASGKRYEVKSFTN